MQLGRLLGPIRFGQEAGRFEAVGMIQSNFGDSGNLEVVGRIADRLVFFWRDSGPAVRWNGSIPLVAAGLGPRNPCIRGDFSNTLLEGV
jgi:hypothetical protein